MNTELLVEFAIVLAVVIVALPLMGQVLAMALGLLVTSRRSRAVADQGAASIGLDVFETRLRRAARVLGSGLVNDEPVGERPQRWRVDPRLMPDRRAGERRVLARRWQARKDSDRRFRERRINAGRRQHR